MEKSLEDWDLNAVRDQIKSANIQDMSDQQMIDFVSDLRRMK